LNDQAKNLKRILEEKTGYDRKARDRKGRAALEIGLALRNEGLDADDEKVLAMMKSVRNVTYYTATRVAEELMAAVSRDYKSFPDVKPYIREFWRLYWGPLGMVEGPDVERAMVAFGRAINAWEDEYEARGKSPKKPIGDRASPSIQRQLKVAGERLIEALGGERKADLTTHQSRQRG
jgi:hypothetical protein